MKRSKAFEEIVGLVPKLAAGELGPLTHRLQALQQFGRNVPAQAAASGGDGATISEADVLSAINSVLFAQGQPTNPLIGRFVSEKFREQLPMLLTFLEKCHRVRAGQLALLRVGLRLLYDDMLAGGIPVTSKTMVEHFYRLPGVFDKHFPGYAQAGLLGVLIERKINNG